MKVTGFLRGSGKVGSLVIKTVSGQTIASEYQPSVSNPNTMAQVNQRAKLKMMSQIATAIAPILAYKRAGMRSARNQFISANIGSAYAADGEAQITYENLQITPGNAGLPSIVIRRADGTGDITIQLAESAAVSVSRVVYNVFTKTSEQRLQLVASEVIREAGDNGTFPAVLEGLSGELVFYAYGMRDLSSKATAVYGDVKVANGIDVARLLSERDIKAEDMQLTETRGATLSLGASEVEPVDDTKAKVFVTANGPGTVSGAGTFALGSQVTVTATPNTGMSFQGWSNNGSQAIISQSAEYTFTLTGQVDLVGRFYDPSGDSAME